MASQLPPSDQRGQNSPAARSSTNEREGSRRAPAGTAWDGALRYLGIRSHSAFEIENKLSRRGYDSEEIEATIIRLRESGLLDDAAFARELAEYLLSSKSSSRVDVGRQLAKRGVSREDAEHALSTITAEGEHDRALLLARKKMRQLLQVAKDVRWRRTLAFLARRGFSRELSYSVVNQVEKELLGDEDYGFA